MAKERRIGVVGLGYVGLPLALAFARKFPGTMGFDSNAEKVKALKAGVDPTGEGLEAALRSSTLTVTDSCDDMRECDFFVVGVPTPITRLPTSTRSTAPAASSDRALSPATSSPSSRRSTPA